MIKNDNNYYLVLKLKIKILIWSEIGRMWNNLLHSFLVDLVFFKSEAGNFFLCKMHRWR